ncbi:MAG: N(4)-(beta-N-acetylglucosaminyl)-L-asparaginase [Chloroflexota bacterium]|nr:N(4)-(beta-N-acetylglucosaminyl)-L-asparaginase [Chloroflexota bacterium]
MTDAGGSTRALLVASSNGRIGFAAAMDVLREGGSAVDAVVAGIAPVEANPEDHSVGYGGLPNLLGVVELDASLMDGRTLATGAVGALRGYRDAIVLARHVMDDLPHVLIAGDGARRLAAEVGLPPVELLTPKAERIWRERLSEHGGDPTAYVAKVREMVTRLSRDPELPDDAHGTVNVIARDRAGNLACGVSTSGWAWKYPGRLGDSPIVGAGNYADNRWGAAACTGRGEMAQRCCTAHSVVAFLRAGMRLESALRTAAADLHALADPYKSEVNIVAVDAAGNHLAVSTVPGKTYVFQTEAMAEPAEAERVHVPPGEG